MNDPSGPARNRVHVAGGAFERALALPFFNVAVAIVILYAVFTAITGETFNTVNNQITIMRAAAVFLILGVGQTFAMTTGGIDISTGSMIGVVGAIVGSGLELGWMDPIYTIPSAILVGAVLGAFNGFNITVLGVPPLLATLGTFVAYRGFTQGIKYELFQAAPTASNRHDEWRRSRALPRTSSTRATATSSGRKPTPRSSAH